ncbi:hypothetical protein AJ87_02160 [Rhizobium yanglingense]|nr:hypothetical protein AJ87_02160 [Rhizobium yanglingense]
MIGFLKALQFTTLTRRVAEACNCDASAIEAADVKVEWGTAAHGPDLDAAEPEPVAGGIPDVEGAAVPIPVKAKPAGKGFTPAELAKARAEAFAVLPFDHSTYVTIRDLATLDKWIGDARATGLVAFDTQTNSLDAMQAELVGFSMAIADNDKNPAGVKTRAAYLPIGHKNGVGDLLGGGLADNQIPMRDVLPRLKALLEDESVPRSRRT